MNKRPKIIWVKTGVLHPLDTGGKLRTYNMLKMLKEHLEITFVAFVDESAEGSAVSLTREYCHEFVGIPFKRSRKFSCSFYAEAITNMLFSNLPFVIGKYRSQDMADTIRRLSSEGYDLIVCDFLTPMINVDRNIGLPVLIFEHNVESMIWQRHYLNQTNPLKQFCFNKQWERMQVFEKESCARSDGVVTVSPQDTEILRNEFKIKNVLGDVPTGVDVDYFRPMPDISRSKSGIVFVGSMDWLPNEDAVLYFTEMVYPLVKKEVENVSLTVVGRNPSERVRKLGRRDGSINVTGTVEDTRPFMAKGSVMVVPLRVGGGTRIKIFEAMAMGIPVVSTSIGAEGLPVTHDKNILIADSPENFAESVINVLKIPDRATSLAERALKMVRENHTWNVVAERFVKYCREVTGEQSRNTS